MSSLKAGRFQNKSLFLMETPMLAMSSSAPYGVKGNAIIQELCDVLGEILCKLKQKGIWSYKRQNMKWNWLNEIFLANWWKLLVIAQEHMNKVEEEIWGLLQQLHAFWNRISKFVLWRSIYMIYYHCSNSCIVMLIMLLRFILLVNVCL